MKRILLCITLLFFATRVFAQQRCNCIEGTIAGNVTMPSKTFNLNGRTLGICGYSGGDSLFSEFVLFECGSDTIVDEWGAMEQCQIKKSGDTLIIYVLYNWPIGNNFSFKLVPFYANAFYYERGRLKKTSYFLNNYRKYTNAEIDQINVDYQHYKPEYNSEITMNYAYLLFWAYVSGSSKAEAHLNSLEAKCGPFDGGVSEEWNEIIMTYAHYKELAGKGLVHTN